MSPQVTFEVLWMVEKFDTKAALILPKTDIYSEYKRTKERLKWYWYVQILILAHKFTNIRQKHIRYSDMPFLGNKPGFQVFCFGP